MAGPALGDAFAYIAIIGFFFFFLKTLLKIAKKAIVDPHAIQKLDDFVKINGYSYDFAFVFHVFDEDDTKFSPYQLKFTMGTIIERLTNAGLETHLFYSCQRDEIYVKVRASMERLKAEADRINYRLLLDSDRAQAKAQSGKKEGSVYVWKPFFITDEHRISPFGPFDYIYGSYTSSPELQGLFKLYATSLGGQKIIFKGVDRIKLILSIIEARVQETGAGLNIGDLLAKQVALAAMPLHDYDELKALQRKWLKLWQFPWDQPVDDVRDYFGERIALYFLYLQHYVTSLMTPALLGLITYIVRVIYITPENFLMPYFTAFMVVWSTFFVEFWKRKQSTAAMKWGVVGYEEEQQDRPQFTGKPSTSPITGKEMTYFPSEEKDKRNQIVTTLIVSMLCGVVCIVGMIFSFQYWMNQPENSASFVLFGVNFASIIVSLLNAVVIAVLNKSYFTVAGALNNYENHRTETDFEDALISKIFTFQLVNSFSALTYVSFIKYFLGIFCTNNNCIGDAAATLSTVFLSGLISRAINEVFVRKLTQDAKTRSETSGLPPGVKASPIEEQYFLAEYNVLNGTLVDYAGLVMQYGFTVLFVGAFPLAPFLACVSSYIQIRIDAWKLCQAHKRPIPRVAEDIGTWQDMIEVLSLLGVIYNFALITLTGHYMHNITWQFRWITFIVIEHFTFGIKLVLAAVIDDVPAEVEMQLQRQEFITSKVLSNAQDDDDEDEEFSMDHSTNVIINDKDYDWIEFDPSEAQAEEVGAEGGQNGDVEMQAARH